MIGAIPKEKQLHSCLDVFGNMSLQENDALPNWLILHQFDDGGVDDYFDKKTGLMNNLEKLIDKCASLISNKNEADFDEVDDLISSFTHHLMVHTIQNGIIYPLSKSYKSAKDVQPKTNDKVIRSFIKTLDLNARSSFIAMCGFQIETILKKIAQKHNIVLKNSMHDRFNDVLTHFAIPIEDKLNLIDIFYWTRNTLHNGGLVDRAGRKFYDGYTYVFEKNKVMAYATWDHLTYFVCEIIGLFKEILNSEKYGAQ